MAFNWSFQSFHAKRPALPQPGEQFARFTVESVLGEGANGRVYRAIDEAQRAVALKLHKSVFDKQRLARFQREGEVAASLDHPGILRVLGGGAAAGFPYLVYELVEGAREFDDYQRGRPLTDQLRLLAELAEAVGHAHAHGVVHRDLKSSNVLVDDTGRVRVTDFGLAKGADDSQALTRTGVLVGTPMAMAPEQLLGKREQVGPHTDVWALGVMLYKTLCDRPPFAATSLVELQAMVLDREPTPPRTLNPEVSGDLQATCLRALAKAPAQRYTTALHLAQDLRACLSGVRPTASGSNLFGARSVASRLPVLPLGALALVVGGVVAVAVFGGDPPRQTPTPTASVDTSARTTPPPHSDSAAGSEAFKKLRSIRNPQDRIAAQREWLERYPDHSATQRVVQQLDRDLLAHPVRILRHGESGLVYGWFTGPRAIVSLGADGNLARWSLDDGRAKRRARFKPTKPFLKATPAGEGFAVSSSSLRLTWLGPDRVVPLNVPAEGVRGSPDGRWLAAAGPTGTVHIYETRTWTVARRLHSVKIPVTGIAFSRQGDRIAVFHADGSELMPTGQEQFFVYALPGAEVVLGSTSIPATCRAALFTDQGTLVVGMASGALQEWDVERGVLTHTFNGPLKPEGLLAEASQAVHRGAVRGILETRDGTRLYTLGFNKERMDGGNELYTWDRATNQAKPPLVRPFPILNLDMAPDERHLLIGTRVGIVEVWDRPD